MDRQTDRWTDGQPDNGDFIGPSAEWGSNIDRSNARGFIQGKRSL